MKKFFIQVMAIVAIALGMSTHAWAADKLLLATGNSKEGSTYAIMGEQLLKVCGGNAITAKETTGGGTTNRQLLTGNEVEMAVLQSDMLEFSRRRDAASVQDIRTLFPLHSEEVHFIARSDVRKEGGFLGYGAKEISYPDLAALSGRTVGAVGGSFDTASVISSLSGLNYKVQRFQSTKEMIDALRTGAIDSVVMVVGAPSQVVADLGSAFKILPIPESLLATMRGNETAAKLYSPAKLTYETLGAMGVQTVSVRAVVATRVYESPEILKTLKDFRACYYSKLTSIRDTRGTHAKWRSTSASLKDGWQWYDLQ